MLTEWAHHRRGRGSRLVMVYCLLVMVYCLLVMVYCLLLMVYGLLVMVGSRAEMRDGQVGIGVEKVARALVYW
jgi:hypothetical protein